MSGDGVNRNGEGDDDRYRLPEEFDGLTIGSPINADMMKVWVFRRAFDPGRLARSQLLIPTTPSGRLQLTANASDSRSQYTSGWNASLGVALNCGIADFSAKFYLRQEKNACAQSTRIALVGHRYAKSKLLLRETPDSKLWFNCATEDFQKKITAVSAAAKAAVAACGNGTQNQNELNRLNQVLVEALDDFYTNYGTGFVCGLDLISYGMVDASWERKTSSDKENLTIGGGIAASLPFIGLGAEIQYVNTHADDKVNTMLKLKAYGAAESSPLNRWATKKVDQINPQSLKAFLAGEAWSQQPSTNVGALKNPELVWSPKEITQLPVPELPGAFGMLSNAIRAIQAVTAKPVKSAVAQTASQPDDAPTGAQPAQAQIGIVAGGSEPQTDIGKMVAALKVVAGFTEKKINAVAFGKLVIDIDDAAKPADPPPVQEEQTSPGTSDADTPATNDTATPELVPDDSGLTELKLNDYAVCGYYYRPWEECFPELKLALECTPAQVVFGQALVWYSMREMFAQYLEFCQAHFDGVSRHRDGTIFHIGPAAEQFRSALDTVSGDLAGDLNNRASKTNLNLVRQLELKLEEKLGDFSLHRHYEFWMENYDWLKLVPFGVVAVIERDGQLYYQRSPYPDMSLSDQPGGCTAVAPEDAWPEELVAAGAYRLYPVISTSAQGKPHFVWVGVPSHLTGGREDASFRYSGLFALNRRNPAETPASDSQRWVAVGTLPDGRPNFQVLPENVRVDEFALPMLIHQSKDAGEEMLRCETSFAWDSPAPDDGVSDEDAREQRWTNRKRWFGMHLYPGVGDDDCFGHEFRFCGGDPGYEDHREKAKQRLLEKAGRLAHEASRYAAERVLPLIPEPEELAIDSHQHNDQEDTAPIPPIWALKEPAGVVGAYFPKRAATFFWGPKAGPGWDLLQPGSDDRMLTPCPVKFIPIDYRHAISALRAAMDADGINTNSVPPWAQAGGGAMWRQPRPELMKRLEALAGKAQKVPVEGI